MDNVKSYVDGNGSKNDIIRMTFGGSEKCQWLEWQGYRKKISQSDLIKVGRVILDGLPVGSLVVHDRCRFPIKNSFIGNSASSRVRRNEVWVGKDRKSGHPSALFSRILYRRNVFFLWCAPDWHLWWNNNTGSRDYVQIEGETAELVTGSSYDISWHRRTVYLNDQSVVEWDRNW